jgi:dihydropyrimidinase
MLDTAVVGGTLVTPGCSFAADVGIAGGKIAAIARPGELPPARATLDAKGRHVLPGLVDPHTHPGNFRPLVEDIRSETRSAAVGGVTTMLGTVKCMRMGYTMKPVAEPADAVSYLAAFPDARRIADEDAHVDVGYSFIVMHDAHADEIPAYVKECGVTSFKFFLTYPTVSEWGARVGMPLFPDEGTVYRGFRAAAATGSLVMIHAENNLVGRVLEPELVASGRHDLGAWEAHYPGALEASEIRKAAYFARLLGCHLYPVHVSSAAGLAAVRAARAEGVTITAETCPQYLVLDLDDEAERGLTIKFNPPVRACAEADVLWAGVADGTLGCLGSDHVANLRERKVVAGDVWRTLPGSPGLATLLPLLLDQGVRAGRITLERLVAVCCEGPARAFDLYPRKGTLQVGADADLVLVDLAQRRAVDPAALHGWSDFSAYEGMELVGWPTLTMLRGRVIMRDGVPEGPPTGRYLARQSAP